MHEFKKFLIKILIAVLFLTGIGGILFIFIVPEKYLPVLPWMLLFFALITVISHGYQFRLAKKDSARFVRSSMIISILRLFIYSFFAIVYFATSTENIAVFVVCLVVFYVVFTFIEVSDLTRISR